MSLSKTVNYIQTQIRDGKVSVAALGFYTYLLGKRGHKCRLKKSDILEELRLSEKTMYVYVRELRSIGVLETEETPGQPTEYQPLILTPEALENLRGGKNKLPPSLSMDSIDSIDCKNTISERIEKGHGKKSRAQELLETVNAKLPAGCRWTGPVPKIRVPELVALSERVNLSQYTAWYAQEKIVGAGKKFTWGLFLYPGMVEEFELKSTGPGAGDVMRSSSRWVGKEDEVETRALERMAKIKKLRGEE